MIFEVRAATEADRPFIRWMDELTETWGDESLELAPDYAEVRRRYVDLWTEAQGGVIIEARDASDEERLPFRQDAVRVDAFDTSFDRVAAFSPSQGAIPLGSAWLRLFSADDPGYGFVAEGIPEAAIAIRPAAVGRGLSRVLIAGLLDHARERGYAGVSLAVSHGNDRARKAYERAGFEFVGLSNEPDHDVMITRFR